MGIVLTKFSYRMHRFISLALLVTLAAVANAQGFGNQFVTNTQGFGNNQFGYVGYGYGGNYSPFSGFNQQYYPNILGGFGFYNQQPYSGYNGCQYWCQSNFAWGGNNQYYCCTTPQQASLGAGGFNNQFGFGNQFGTNWG